MGQLLLTWTAFEQSTGAFWFGTVVGFLAALVVWNAVDPNVRWFSSMLGVLGGAVVTTLFKGDLFAPYSVGMASGFFGGFVLLWMAPFFASEIPFPRDVKRAGDAPKQDAGKAAEKEADPPHGG